MQVSKIHRNFVYTLDMVNQLREMYDKLDYIESLLVADKQDPLGPAPNLLVIHYHLTQLETFRNETVLQAKRSGDTSAEALQTLQLYFERLDALLKEFEEHYINLAKSLIDLAREGQAAVAVKIAKIAEVEGARDEKAIAIKLVKKKGAELASKFKSLQADAVCCIAPYCRIRADPRWCCSVSSSTIALGSWTPFDHLHEKR